MLSKDLLQQLNLGNSVAEFDDALERYFVETETFRSLVNGSVDIIAGDKGTGKTALFQILSKRYASLPALGKVEVIAAFNPIGNPVFQRLTEGATLTEGQYITVWKSYLLALAGNWILELWEGQFTDRMFELDRLLRSLDLRTSDNTASTVFTMLVNLIRRLATPKAAQVSVSVTPQGIPIVVPRVEFEDSPEGPKPKVVRHDDALGLLNTVVEEVDLSLWLVIDRLDEAFQGFPDAEIPALRALLRTYLDLAAFPAVRLKLFMRRDLFSRIIAGGFVNLTHVNARKVDLIWDEEDLYHLLFLRMAESSEFVTSLGLGRPDSQSLFNAVFPAQVDAGSRKPTTWNWILSRIRDGNGVRPPRNLIDLVKKAQEVQLRREERASTMYVAGHPLISSDSMKAALTRLSQERVNDTLLAEARDHAATIDQFRDGKAEQNNESLAGLLHVSQDEVREAVKPLLELGFLEQVGSSYKVPILYRQGLRITQGKAFAEVPGDVSDATDDDED